MEQQQAPKEQDFDIVIVGAGPSAAGLLHGLLHRIILDRCCSSSSSGEDDDGISGKKSLSNLSHLRIVILERGNNFSYTTHNSTLSCAKAADDDGKIITSSLLLFEHCHPSTFSLQNWFQTAHYVPPTPSLSCKATRHPTILYTTTPQSHLSNRIIDVPTGTGWGGGTNINAGLVMQPQFGNDFDKNDNWPGRWKGGDLIQNSMDEIVSDMKKNKGLLLSTSLGNDFLLPGSEEGEEDGSSEEDGFMSSFERPTLSSSTTRSSSDNIRVNYFTSLIAPLLERHPELHSNITFLSGVQVERILIRCSCDAGHDDNCDDDLSTRQQQQQQQYKLPQAWAVECNYGDYHGIIRAKDDIILCSGAIATPSLLLASGIGTEDDLRMAGITPWYEQIKCNYIHNANNSHVENVSRNLPVGHNLRDHILLPRVFLTPRRCNSGTLSYNSINGWWMIHAPTSSSTIAAKMQLQLADGIQIEYMIPHFAAGALRRRWILPLLDVHLPLAWMQGIFLRVRAVLRVFFGIPLSSKWVKQRIRFLNLCLLNPKSVGQVTVRSSSSSSSSRMKSFARLGDCKVIIDPNYLSDSRDVESLWRGWTYSSRVKQRLFRRGIEILPGHTFSIGYAACSLLSSAIRRVKAAFLGGELHNKNEPEYGGNEVPQWFRKYAAEFSNPYYHWCGTCAMGGEDSSMSATTLNLGSVVDEHLCVRGLSNLRVCDASVFPDTVSAPTALTCTALGHAASSFIIE
jgi:choline dehydrogenase-like flavoprotein